MNDMHAPPIRLEHVDRHPRYVWEPVLNTLDKMFVRRRASLSGITADNCEVLCSLPLICTTIAYDPKSISITAHGVFNKNTNALIAIAATSWVLRSVLDHGSSASN